MKVYVTGRSGFVGQALLRSVEQGQPGWKDVELCGCSLLDIRDLSALTEDLDATRPDVIIHLAAQSNVPESIKNPLTTVAINVHGTLNVIAAMEQASPKSRLLFVGSSDQYGYVSPEALPISESQPLAPRNPYAASKASAEMFVLERVRRGKLNAVCARSFNHTGPGQDARFVFPAIANQLAEIKLAMRPPELLVGDIDVTRDFLDIQAVLDAYRMLLEQGETGGVYNVCSGKEFLLRDGLSLMAEALGVNPEIRQDPALCRPAEQRRACGDNSRLRNLGWTNQINFADTLRRLAEHRLNVLQSS